MKVDPKRDRQMQIGLVIAWFNMIEGNIRRPLLGADVEIIYQAWRIAPLLYGERPE